jgi:hypothetical protein
MGERKGEGERLHTKTSRFCHTLKYTCFLVKKNGDKTFEVINDQFWRVSNVFTQEA